MQGRFERELSVELDETAAGLAGAVVRNGGPAIPFEGWLGLAAAVQQLLSGEAPEPRREETS